MTQMRNLVFTWNKELGLYSEIERNMKLGTQKFPGVKLRQYLDMRRNQIDAELGFYLKLAIKYEQTLNCEEPRDWIWNFPWNCKRICKRSETDPTITLRARQVKEFSGNWGRILEGTGGDILKEPGRNWK